LSEQSALICSAGGQAKRVQTAELGFHGFCGHRGFPNAALVRADLRPIEATAPKLSRMTGSKTAERTMSTSHDSCADYRTTLTWNPAAEYHQQREKFPNDSG
jgi:hypothetical protein